MKYVFIFLITIYQKIISPYLMPSCRFVPSCSVYAKGVLMKYGIFKGLLLAIWRVLRCNPLSKKTYDPIP